MTFGIAMLVAFLMLIGFAAFADNITPPSGMQQIDPTKVSQTPPFDKPGLHRLADGSYEAYYVAQVFSFNPATLTIPVGSKVTVLRYLCGRRSRLFCPGYRSEHDGCAGLGQSRDPRLPQGR
jgi:TRAP-type uncharacterized transport system fused permease subunit